MRPRENLILGAGVTGLAAAMTSSATAYEAERVPGGLCRSYYLCPGSPKVLRQPPAGQNWYRFDFAGGHWIFGDDPALLLLIHALTPVKSYQRRSAVYFPDDGRLVPYPLQNHLSYLGKETAARALHEITHPPRRPVRTLADWLVRSFGPTLTDLFFGPFHELYTAGLWTRVAPGDVWKSPVDLSFIVQGAAGPTQAAGYNTSFVYPVLGIGSLAARMARRARVRYGKRAARIHLQRREVEFADGSGERYSSLVSTIPLDRMLALAGVSTGEPDPWTSVLVLNIGATPGPRCPRDHWIYVPGSKSGFHRIGFYSNVDESFLPARDRPRVSIYVERAFAANKRPDGAQLAAYCASVVSELREWDFIREAEVIHPNWIETAYTFSLPGSEWRKRSLSVFERNQVLMAGRYAAWRFQGVMESLRDGLTAGTVVRSLVTARRKRG